MNDDEQAATKRDLREAIDELKRYVVEREVNSIRWLISIFGALQVTYFFGTLAMVYFLITHLKKPS